MEKTENPKNPYVILLLENDNFGGIAQLGNPDQDLPHGIKSYIGEFDSFESAKEAAISHYQEQIQWVHENYDRIKSYDGNSKSRLAWKADRNKKQSTTGEYFALIYESNFEEIVFAENRDDIDENDALEAVGGAETFEQAKQKALGYYQEFEIWATENLKKTNEYQGNKNRWL